MIASVRRTAIIAALCLLAVPAAAAGAPAHPQQKFLGSETLTQFKVRLIATAGTGTESARATVTAVGYQFVGSAWQRVATKTIGQPDQWYWTIVGCARSWPASPSTRSG
jgi:hypothetical protein